MRLQVLNLKHQEQSESSGTSSKRGIQWEEVKDEGCVHTSQEIWSFIFHRGYISGDVSSLITVEEVQDKHLGSYLSMMAETRTGVNTGKISLLVLMHMINT